MKYHDLSKPFLGPLDADDDNNLREYFVSFGNFSGLLGKELFVVVGAKGTGKSAIKRHLCEIRKEKQRHTIDLQDTYGFSLSHLKTSSPSEIKNKMKGYFIALILKHLIDSPNLPSEHKEKLKSLTGEMSLFKKLIKPLKLKTPFAEYAIKDLFPDNRRVNLLTMLDSAVSNAIVEALGEDDLWILVDDIDTVFTSDDEESSLRFIEGLIYSASDLSFRIFKRAVWIVLLLRSEIYEELTRKATELDKETPYFWEIAWDGESLKKLLAERIRWAFGMGSGEAVWKYWALLFDVKDESDTSLLQEYLIERSINGPRDLLLLIDMSRKMAAKQNAQKIDLSHVKESEYEYGKMKLRQITSNFQRIYAQVDRVIDRLFRGSQQIYSREDLEKHINDDLLTSPNAKGDFIDLRWLHTCNAFLFTEILYRIGFIGYLDPDAKRYIYVLEKSNPDKTLISSAEFKIHSAFTSYLELNATTTSIGRQYAQKLKGQRDKQKKRRT
jgi:hypothetical protein